MVYMPPELLRVAPSLFPNAAAKNPDSRPKRVPISAATQSKTDVWAFGVLLAAMATGNRPWDAAWRAFCATEGSMDALPVEVGMCEEEKQALAVCLAGMRPAPEALDECVAGLSAVVAACMHEEPARRPTFAELSVDLKRIVDGLE